MDCNRRGQCLSSKGISQSHPQKECFCEPGFFGKYCENVSALKEKIVNFENYKEIILQDNAVKFLWRVATKENESYLEGVVVCNTSSYVAIGWRPANLTSECRNYPKDAPAPESTAPSILHPMDCQDMVVGKVKGDGSNIGDYYTRDRSTPQRDEFYGGNDDLTSAMGWEVDGVTTIKFRKRLNSKNVSQSYQDHNFDGKIVLIWAHGQQNHSFYAMDNLHYHGRRNRGAIALDTSSLPDLPAKHIETSVTLTAAFNISIVLLGIMLLIQVADNLYIKHKQTKQTPQFETFTL
jgi:hypothetical protein